MKLNNIKYIDLGLNQCILDSYKADHVDWVRRDYYNPKKEKIMKKILVYSIFIFCFSLLGCGGNDINSNKVEEYLITSEKSLPDNFHLIATESNDSLYLLQKASNNKENVKLWKEFGMEKQVPNINFTEYDTYFIGIYESSSCPFEIDDIEVSAKIVYMKLSSFGGDCTADASPRNFVIKINKNISEEIEELVLEIYGKQISLFVE